MIDLLTEILPEGDSRAWVSLNDGLTRLLDLTPLMTLVSHQTLQMPRVARCPKLTDDGQFVRWPGGAYLDLRSVKEAPHGPLFVGLLGLFPTTQRFRPLGAWLRHAESNVYGYTDIRPLHTVQGILGLRTGQFESLLSTYQNVPQDLLIARMSDLALFLSTWFSQEAVPALMKRPWPYAIQRFPENPLLDTAAGCLCAGRIDLIEAPLLSLVDKRY